MEQTLYEEMKAPIELELRRGANWFFWIAGLSLINSIALLFGSEFSFVIGLGITQIIDQVFFELFDSSATAFTLIFDLIPISFFVLLGVFARRRYTWAFVLGMIIYIGDSLLFLFAGDYLCLAFHAFVLYSIFKGLKAKNNLNKIIQTSDFDKTTTA